MEFYCLGSGSGGNSYIFKSGKDCVLVECGFEYKRLCKKIMDCGLAISDINAVVCTHHHKDHIMSISNWVNRKVKVVAPENCFSDIELRNKNVYHAENGTKLDLTDNIRILAFSVNHDCNALGYIFYFKDTRESVLFINDTYYFDFNYNDFGFDYIFIECNHIRNKLDQVISKCVALGKSSAKYSRQCEYHMSLAALKKFLDKMNLAKTKQIYLMHMSYDCCDRDLCQKVISTNYGIETYACLTNGGFALDNFRRF